MPTSSEARQDLEQHYKDAGQFQTVVLSVTEETYQGRPVLQVRLAPAYRAGWKVIVPYAVPGAGWVDQGTTFEVTAIVNATILSDSGAP